ncbi:MAG: deoxyribose-phosphate aldolase [Gammaproteobacteria bacterium]|nr:deoxyribose-phosphate aldolase [Gammaproteobacteria bacterium]
MTIHATDIARTIDHTLLAPEATPERVTQLCREAHEHGFYSVCIAPVFVGLAGKELAGSSVQVCTVVGFPTGMSEPEVKAYETGLALRRGADEVDMVMNIGAARAGDWQQVRLDIAQVVARAEDRPVKVILETCLLTDEEKQQACKVCVAAGAAFVKTSTGFSHGGATEADVRLMRAAVGPDLGVKASGGIRDYATACRMLEAGATRLGTSSGLKIVAGERDLSAADAY